MTFWCVSANYMYFDPNSLFYQHPPSLPFGQPTNIQFLHSYQGMLPHAIITLSNGLVLRNQIIIQFLEDVQKGGILRLCFPLNFFKPLNFSLPFIFSLYFVIKIPVLAGVPANRFLGHFIIDSFSSTSSHSHTSNNGEFHQYLT